MEENPLPTAKIDAVRLEGIEGTPTGVGVPCQLAGGKSALVWLDLEQAERMIMALRAGIDAVRQTQQQHGLPAARITATSDLEPAAECGMGLTADGHILMQFRWPNGRSSTTPLSRPAAAQLPKLLQRLLREAEPGRGAPRRRGH